MKTLQKLLYFLTHSERKKAGLLLIIILIMAILEVLGVASILPFMSVITNPSLIETNIILNTMFNVSKKFGIETKTEFSFFLGILMFLLLISSLSFKALSVYAQSKFIYMGEWSISKRLLETYLYQPYSWFLGRNSAELGAYILSEVGLIVKQGISPMLNIISQSTVTISLIVLLFLVDIKLTLIVIFVIGGAYVLIYYFLRISLDQIGRERLFANESRFKSINETFGASKEIKVAGLEQTFINRFSNSSLTYAKHQASAQLINSLPRFIIEAIVFGGMLLLVAYIILKLGNFSNALPIITLYAFAGYRLIPSLQQIYIASVALKFSKAPIDALYNDLKNLNVSNSNHNQDQEILPFNKSITLKQIHYNYPNSSRKALDDINLTIDAKKNVGIVGSSGSGKTTAVDIITGLLEPQKGTIEIDGEVITKKNVKAWRRSIGYVPQHIHLNDDSIAANIAVGVDFKNINYQSVEKAAKAANLHEFVENKLPGKYQTIIGEQGVRLSGGQRQRIGIARAMYHNPKVLIFDEATSALDNQTEETIIKELYNLRKDITIIMIAHRLNTLKDCDIIFKLENGKIIV
jgi:ABC-type bacteriocin/lantibiotic exporter with double-glycine peptidase domain